MLLACEEVSIESIKVLFQNKAILVNRKETKHLSFMRSINDRKLEVCRCLIELGAHVNAQTEDSTNPLDFSDIQGFVPIVQLLLQHGADVSAYCPQGLMPLHTAA